MERRDFLSKGLPGVAGVLALGHMGFNIKARIQDIMRLKNIPQDFLV
jgi:hypothetical protein